MNYQWDPKKAASNREKHGISFADAVTVFSDDLALLIADEYNGEERFAIIGRDAFQRLVVVIYTWCGDECIRIISARKATRHERAQYEG